MPTSSEMGRVIRRLTSETAALSVVIATLALGVLLLGGTRAIAACALATVSLVAFAVAARNRRRRGLVLSLVGLPFAIGIALTTLSLVPLPLFVRELISPESAWRTESLRAML